MPQVVLKNGVSYGWGNISLVLFNVPVVGITKIKYNAKQKKENQYGAGPYPVSRGFGNYEYEASLEFFLEEWAKIQNASPDRDPLQIDDFDIIVQYGGSRLTAKTDVLKSCQFMEDGVDTSQGDTKILVTIPLIIGGIVHK